MGQEDQVLITNIIQTFLIGWIITRFVPFQTYFVGTLEGINKGLFKSNALIGQCIGVLSCIKCFCLWFGIIYFNNIWVGISASLIAYQYDKIDGNIKMRL